MRGIMRCALFLLVLAPSIASAQPESVGHLRFAGYLALGLAGEAEYAVDASSIDLDLDPTVGFGVRGEYPVHEYFAIGGLFELLTFEPEDTVFFDSEREAVFDIDLWLKGRYTIAIQSDLALELYAGLPFGLALAVLNDPDGTGDETYAGYNIGILAGAMLLFGDHFGGFFELGWRHHGVFHEENNTDFSVNTHQLGMHFGFLYQM